jgi:TRAP-type C4-dicarboxylate transport system permease small subunit
MNFITEAARKVSYVMHILSGVLLVSMMLITMADIFSRMIFSATDGSIDVTFLGGIELISYGLLFMVLFSLPYSVSRGQVIVDLFTEGMSNRLKEFLTGFYTFGFGLLGLGMSYGLYHSMQRVAENGETTQDLLIPMQYVYGLATAPALLLALRGFLVAFERMAKSRSMQ